MSSAWMWLKLKMPFPFLERPPTHRQAPAKKPTIFLDVDHLWYAASVLNRTHGGAKTILWNPLWNLQGGRACHFRDMNWNLGTMGSLLNNSRLSLGAVSFAKVSTIKFTIQFKTCIQQPEFSSKPLLSELPLIFEVYMFCQFWVWDFVGLDIFSVHTPCWCKSSRPRSSNKLDQTGRGLTWLQILQDPWSDKLPSTNACLSSKQIDQCIRDTSVVNAASVENTMTSTSGPWNTSRPVDGKTEKPSYRIWPKCSKSITMCRPLDSQNGLHHGIVLVREKWWTSHLLPAPVRRLWSTSLVDRWKGDEHTQGVSSLSPWLVRNAEIGYKSCANILADMSCSFNLHPDTGRVWFSTIEAYVVWTKHLPAVIFSQLLLAFVRTEKYNLGFNCKTKGTEWYKWHQPKIREVERFEAALTLAHWAGNGHQWALCQASGSETQECWLSL